MFTLLLNLAVIYLLLGTGLSFGKSPAPKTYAEQRWSEIFRWPFWVAKHINVARDDDSIKIGGTD